MSEQKTPLDHFSTDLRAAVEAERSGEAAGAISALVRRTAPLARLDAMSYADRGDKIALRLARSVDIIIKSLFEAAPRGDGALAICAVGGYGRRELAPFSDVDLLILHEPGKDDGLRPALDFILYPLWDSGIKIGHGVHTPKSAVAFAKSDLIARTAYLDIRFVVGSNALYREFLSGYDKLRQRTGPAFIAAKLKEQAERQKRADETRYLVEPDIKDGKGGLRDVQTIRWIYKYYYGGRIGNHEKIDRILGKTAVRDLIKAEQFFWSVRAHLHDLRGRADELLTFDIQPAVAERLGYADRRDMSAAERLMRHYFVTTVDTGRLTRILCARLEEESAKKQPRLGDKLPAELQKDEAPGRPALRIRNGRLDFAKPAASRKNPVDFFRLFRAFSKNPKIDFHPDALAIVSENIALVTSQVRNDPVVSALFRGILESRADPVRTLRVMTETGLLGKILPAYGEIVGRIHYSLYRRYTLDEQVLRSIAIFNRIRAGKEAKTHPVSSLAVKNAPDPFLYVLALLLHESVWTVERKSSTSAESLIGRIAKRLGVSKSDASLVAWAVANYQLLIRTAERRNLTEARTIARFAELVGSQDRLEFIVVLSTCHLRVVSQDAWDAVIRRQLIELYEATTAWLEGGEAALNARFDERIALARATARTRLTDWSDDDKTLFLSQISDDMLRCVDADTIVRFAYLARAAERDAASAAVTVTPRDGDLECIVYAEDRPGLLADIAGAVASAGLSVRSFQALTTVDGRAFDIFAVQSADGLPVDDARLAQRLHERLLAAARESPDEAPNLRRRMGDRRTIFNVEPVVRIEPDASTDALIVETEALDRPGLLYVMADALADLKISIRSAHIATYGERAVDAFYLVGADGRKITQSRVHKKIEERLLKVITSGAAP